ncbi:MAG: hypothetical protein FWH48_08590, partial [Oscillospiraceae bacterium]|nr:hypothetical protein [Oscillospiraceae bacterium]
MNGEKKAQMQKYVLTCPLRCYGTQVKHAHGAVEGAENILNDGGAAVKITSKKPGDKPFFIIDMGKSTPGGYPIFKIKSQKANPVLRISYSDWYDHLLDPLHGENGDYRRGTATYLGVELPVPPANPYRYELYTITSPGIYASPMIQGQQRAVRFQLDTEGELEIEWYYIENVSDRSEYGGYFNCSDENITKLWYASAYTCQLASFANSNAWEIVNGRLAARGLAKSNDVGLILDEHIYSLSDYSFEFFASISKNPGSVSSAGWAMRAKDKDNCMVFRLDLDGRFYVKRKKDGAYKTIKEVLLDFPVIDNKKYHIKTVACGDTFETYIDGTLIDTTIDDTYKAGSCGFCQGLDQWAFFERATLRNLGGGILFFDDFGSRLGKWDFDRTLSFVADGAKRDRLPWSGDLDWAGRNLYYSFKTFNGYSYMRDSLLMFAFNTTPEGYVWATCYPENKEPPKIGDYGYYQSDIFSAWFVPTLADYLLYSGDLSACAAMYDVMKADLDYLWEHTEGEGLHFQRHDTSKGLWDHVLGATIGKYTYNNILIWDALCEGAFVAENLGFSDDAALFLKRAELMQEAINRYLWHENESEESGGYFVTHKGSEAYCFMSNALALAVKFVDCDRAKKIRDRFATEEFFHGKIVSLVIRGLYEYGFDSEALARLYKPGDRINWFAPLEDDRGPCTTWECMLYPVGAANGSNWGDLSHPDTAMAHIASGYMLGIQPVKAGFAEYKVRPLTAGLDF